MKTQVVDVAKKYQDETLTATIHISVGETMEELEAQFGGAGVVGMLQAIVVDNAEANIAKALVGGLKRAHAMEEVGIQEFYNERLDAPFVDLVARSRAQMKVEKLKVQQERATALLARVEGELQAAV